MKGISVLLVDDQEAVRRAMRSEVEFVCRSLGLFGDATYAEAEGPGETLSGLVAERSFDLAVVDYQLLDGNGFDVLKSLAPFDPLCETKIVLYSARAETQRIETAVGALRHGAHSFVRKGTDDLREELVRILRTVWIEQNRAMVGRFVDVRLRSKLADPTTMKRLGDGCIVEKGFLFCDITASTPFIKTLQGSIASSGVVGPVLRRMFSWMADIIQSKGGVLDKFIGDELMAYFGDSLEGEQRSAAEVTALCDAMVEAALEIRHGFRAKLDAVLKEVGVHHRPTVMPFVKTIINYDSVIWVVLGSDTFMDLTIITDGVIRAARVMQHRERRKRLIGAGDIYVMERVATSLTPDRFVIDPFRVIKLRDFEDERIGVQRILGYAEGGVPSTAVSITPSAAVGDPGSETA